MSTPKWIDDMIEATYRWVAEISGIPVDVWRSDTAVAALTEPPEDWSDLAKDIHWIINATPSELRRKYHIEPDRRGQAIERVVAEWSTKNLGADKAATSGAAHEVEFYGGDTTQPGHDHTWRHQIWLFIAQVLYLS